MIRFSRLVYAFYGLVLIGLGVGYLPPTAQRTLEQLPKGIDKISTLGTIWIYGVLWFIVGAAGLITAVWVPLRKWVYAVGAQVFLCTMWSLAYLAGWILEGARSYPGFLVFFGQSLLLLLMLTFIVITPVVRDVKLFEGLFDDTAGGVERTGRAS